MHNCRSIQSATRHIAVLAAVLQALVPCLVQAQEEVPDTVQVSGEVDLEEFELWSRFRPRISLRHQSGQTVGLERSISSISAWIPFSRPDSDWVLFADLHGLFLSDHPLGSNTGLGARRYLEDNDLTVGVSLYYDYLTTGINSFQQLSPGFELLGTGWEARLNGYFPQAFDPRQTAPNRFAGNLLFTDRFESAMTGFDTEAGIDLPELGATEPRVYAGFYHLQADHRPQVWGWKGRLEADVSDAVGLSLAVQNDDFFDTTVNFGIEVRFAAGALLEKKPWERISHSFQSRPGQWTAERKLASGVRRFSNMIVDRSEETLAIDPPTGQPLMILHVAAGGNSDGSFEDPYATLTDAVNDTRYQNGDISIIYVRGDRASQPAVHTGALALEPNSRVLSNGPLQFVPTQTGPQLLPLSGSDMQLTALPRIVGEVSLSTGAQLSGFQLEAASGDDDAILLAGTGSTLMDPIIDHNVFMVPEEGIGLRISQSATNALITKNKMMGPGENIDLMATEFEGSGILITDSASFTGNIVDNEIMMLAGDAIAVVDSNFDGTINDNLLSNNRNGVRLFERFGSTGDPGIFKGTLNENRIVANRSNGIQFNRQTAGTMTDKVQIDDNIIDQNALSGIEILESSFTGNIDDNEITGTFAGGFVPPAELSRIFSVSDGEVTIDEAVPRDSGIRIRVSTVTGDITNNTVSNNPYAGIFIENDSDSGNLAFTGNIAGNTLTDNRIFGIGINGDRSQSGNDSFTGDIRDNTLSGSSAAAVLLTIDEFTGDIASNMISSSGQGILLAPRTNVVPERFTGDIVNNTVTQTSGSGIEVFFKDFTGGIANNTVTGVMGDTGSGIAIKLTGNYSAGATMEGITDNIVSMKGLDGLSIDVQGTFTGLIARNNLSNNGMNGLSVRVADASSNTGTLTGSIKANTSTDNGMAGLAVSNTDVTGMIDSNVLLGNATGMSLTSTDATVSNNEVRLNTGTAMLIMNSRFGELTGNIVDNNASGIVISGTTVLSGPVTISGNSAVANSTGPGLSINSTLDARLAVEQNILSMNGGDGLSLAVTTASAFTTAELIVQNNVADGNDGFGITYGLNGGGMFLSTIQNNSAEDNDQEGLSVVSQATSTMAAANNLTVNANTLGGNNSSGREVLIQNGGPGNLFLQLTNNTSDNAIIAPNTFNFDVLNTGGGAFNFGTNSDNSGTVGSSDASVTVP